jgi:hypothetical protein
VVDEPDNPGASTGVVYGEATALANTTGDGNTTAASTVNVSVSPYDPYARGNTTAALYVQAASSKSFGNDFQYRALAYWSDC